MWSFIFNTTKLLIKFYHPYFFYSNNLIKKRTNCLCSLIILIFIKGKNIAPIVNSILHLFKSLTTKKP